MFFAFELVPLHITFAIILVPAEAFTPKAPTEKNTTTTTTPRSKATINKVETIDQPYETDSNVLQQEATDSAVLGKANALSRTIVPLGNLSEIFSDQAADADGLDFFVLLPSADMPTSSELAITALTFYASPEESEITFDTFPFKTQEAGTNSYPRLLAYRFRAYEAVYNALLS